MTGTEVAVIIAAVIAAFGTVGGTLWTQRRSGPEMTKVVMHSVKDHVEYLDQQVKEQRAALEKMALELDAFRLEVEALERDLRVERQRNAILVSAMRKAGLSIPNLPTRPAPTIT